MLELYELAWKPAAALIARTDATRAHDRTLELMRRADAIGPLAGLSRAANRAAFPVRPTHVGGVELPYPLILAAGLVKGDGFAAEDAALAAVRAGRDIVPGWRSAPALLGPVEIGSFTRHPRMGNRGRVFWRDSRAGWMQNRVGLRNPGARAAAAHLARHAAQLPRTWGLNLAASPGVDDVGRAREEIVEAAACFSAAFDGLEAGPSWVTLNLSCPNTEDDPQGRQSADLAHALGAALVAAVEVPVWVKLGPDLSDAQLRGLVEALAAAGARALVATNTLARPVPGTGDLAGVSGSLLRDRALDTVVRLKRAIDVSATPLDIVGGGGILTGSDLRAFLDAGAATAMVYTALVLRGPLAGALILREAEAARPHA